MKNILLILVVFISSLNICYGKEKESKAYYVFYLHGQIVEGTDGAPVSETYGRYEYNAIVDALKERGYKVISEIRAANANAKAYSLKVSSQIDSLKRSGVSSDHITVVGASKGALIAMLVSGMVRDKQLKYVLMAGCNERNKSDYKPDLYGQVLSIYEKTDAVGTSCNSIKEASNGITRYKEVQINTGLQHGFLYKPLKAWLALVDEWVKR